jgi:tetratricopeptide (TPR) repeat protein
VRGEALLHRWEFEKAAAEFREAVTIDPGFALAHYRLSMASSWWQGTQPEARAAAERAAALKDRLSPPDRDLVQANVLYITGRPSDAMPILESALARDPEHKEILYLLSECYTHSLQHADFRRANELMERLLALDPNFHIVYDHLIMNYSILGEFPKAHEKLDAWEAKEPDTVRKLRATVSLFEGRLDEALRLSERFDGPYLPIRAGFALEADRFDIVQSILKKYKGGDDQAGAYKWIQATLYENLGQFEAAQATLRELVPARLEADELDAVTPNAVGALTSLADLADLKGDHQAARREAERALLVQPEGPSCLYYTGLFAIRAGDVSAAERYLRTLERVAKGAHEPLGRHCRDALMAEIALARGRPSEARPLLEDAVGSGMIRYDTWALSVGSAFRDGLVRTYLAVGDKKKAAEALEGLFGVGNDVLRSIRGRYRLGKLDLELGDRARGREHLKKFLEYWGRADWDLPEVRDARAQLASLTR